MTIIDIPERYGHPTPPVTLYGKPGIFHMEFMHEVDWSKNRP